jgi:hypothetical protein
MSTAAPAAWTPRQAIITGSAGAGVQPSEALPNTSRAARKHRRRPMLSAARPAGSSNAASTIA